MKNTFDLIYDLAHPAGVSGNEELVRSFIELHIDDVYDYSVDHIGNLIVKSWGHDIKYLFTAHMDELGLIVSGYDGCKIKFAAVGGTDPRTLPNTQWRTTDHKYGVIGLPAPHITKDRNSVIPIEDLRIDVGLEFEDNVKELFPIGTVFVNAAKSFCSGNNFFSRNVDNRAGCAALVMLMDKLKDREDCAFAFLVREEIGLQGARAFINDELKAEYIINLDVCLSDKLGDGAVINIKDGGYMADQSMVERFKRCGAKNFEVSSGGTSDHAVGQLFAKTCGVSFPSSYIHSGVSKVNLNDIEDAVDLCEKFVEVE